MALPVSFFSQTINDNTIKGNGEAESASWAVPITTLTAANVVAKTALVNDLTAAVADLVIGRFAKNELVFARNQLSRLPADTLLAQRENKLLLRYTGNVANKIFRVSIPTFDLTTLPDNQEFLDLTTGLGAALKVAFEAIVVSPDDAAETVSLLSAQFVGRNT